MQSLYEENMELRDLLRHYKSSINVLNDQLMELTKERNKYRSQAIMRQNKIALLEGQLEQAYE